MKIDLISFLISLSNSANQQKDKIDFLNEVETALLKIRFENKIFETEYNRAYFSSSQTKQQATYVLALWCFLYYSGKNFQSVLHVIESFLEYDFGFLTEVDFERNKSGMIRAHANLRFASDQLKKWEVISEEKRDDWSAYVLTEKGKNSWKKFEEFLSNKTPFPKISPFNDKFFEKKAILEPESIKFILTIKEKAGHLFV